MLERTFPQVTFQREGCRASMEVGTVSAAGLEDNERFE